MIGIWLKERRLLLGITQAQLFDRLGYLSNGQFISNIEREKANIPIKRLKEWAKALNISKEELRELILNEHMRRFTER